MQLCEIISKQLKANRQLRWACRSAASLAQQHHRHEPLELLPQCAQLSIGTLPPNGPLRSGRDQPSAESRLRDALTFPTSSSLRPTGLPTGGTERVSSLPAIAGWLRISGMKRGRIFGTDNKDRRLQATESECESKGFSEWGKLPVCRQFPMPCFVTLTSPHRRVFRKECGVG